LKQQEKIMTENNYTFGKISIYDMLSTSNHADEVRAAIRRLNKKSNRITISISLSPIENLRKHLPDPKKVFAQIRTALHRIYFYLNRKGN